MNNLAAIVIITVLDIGMLAVAAYAAWTGGGSDDE